MAVTKIATCCYCGTKAALVLRGKERHELACGNCGAPLHAMKMLPERNTQAKTPVRAPQPRHAYQAQRPKKKPKKRKTVGRRLMAGLWDVLEDVVEEVFD